MKTAHESAEVRNLRLELAEVERENDRLKEQLTQMRTMVANALHTSAVQEPGEFDPNQRHD